MSALDDALTQAEIAPYSDMNISPARKELAQLRAELGKLESDHSLLQKRLEAVIADRDDYAAKLTQSKIEVVRANERIAEMARQLDSAREIFENIFKRDWTNTKINDKARAWLAANPAPETEPQP